MHAVRSACGVTAEAEPDTCLPLHDAHVCASAVHQMCPVVLLDFAESPCRFVTILAFQFVCTVNNHWPCLCKGCCYCAHDVAVRLVLPCCIMSRDSVNAHQHCCNVWYYQTLGMNMCWCNCRRPVQTSHTCCTA